MEIPVFIVPLPNHAGYCAKLGAPFDLSAEAATADEAQRCVEQLLKQKLQQGAELRTLQWLTPPSSAGWLPDDSLTREWLKHIQDYRAECDERDRLELQELEQGDDEEPPT